MTTTQHSHALPARSAIRNTVVASLALLLGACAASAPELGLGTSNQTTASIAQPAGKADPRSDLRKGLDYWGRKYVKSPSDKEAALNYAKNLKAFGDSKQAYLVLQQASVIHGNDREIASEYGRLALEQGKLALASKLLALADDRTSPDWRVVSGRGTALARQGKFKPAIAMFERAHQLAPSNPTVLNNLALAHAGNGDLQQAEVLLRQANQNPMARAKVAKNLSLILGLKGNKAPAPARTERPQVAEAKKG